MYNPVSHSKKFHKKIISKASVKKAYDSLEGEFSLMDAILKARTESGLTQKEIADKMGTKASAISRLGSTNDKRSPSINTLKKFAEAVGCRLKIEFHPA